MTDFGDNLLTVPLIDVTPNGALSLPGLFAALARDEVEHFPALRPHQAPAWHMFLVQLAALAMHRGGSTEMPSGEDEWRGLLRGLTRDFPDDEPWRLVVKDSSKPAFLQPPVPEGVKLNNAIPCPDTLDLLITSKNHDLKRAVARRATPQDWIFALVSLQTGEGYGGAGNQGIARMNGGSSSRPMLALAPLPSRGEKAMTPRPGAWLRRDVRALLEARDRELEASEHLGFPAEGGIGLVWLGPWPEVEQLRLPQLDIWFIEICRRLRLVGMGKKLSAVKGTSKSTRIDAKTFKGALGDPFAPVHKTENKSLTLGEGDFDYRRLTDLLLSGDWSLPLLAKPASFERQGETLALVCAALSRGNSKTDGFIKTWIRPKWAGHSLSDVKAVAVESWLGSHASAGNQGENAEPHARDFQSRDALGVLQHEPYYSSASISQADASPRRADGRGNRGAAGRTSGPLAHGRVCRVTTGLRVSELASLEMGGRGLRRRARFACRAGIVRQHIGTDENGSKPQAATVGRGTCGRAHSLAWMLSVQPRRGLTSSAVPTSTESSRIGLPLRWRITSGPLRSAQESKSG